MKKSYKDGVYGTVLGQAIGDALGHPTEFMSKPCNIKTLSGNNTFTDDTQMAMAIAEAIITIQPEAGADADVIDQFMQEMAANFVRWAAGDPRWGNNDRSPGGTCMAGVRNLRSDGYKTWQSSGSGNQGKGNGGVMRVSMVGAAYWQNPYAAFQYGALSSVPTHNNLESILASGVCAAVIAQTIQGVPLAHALGVALDWASDYPSTLISIPVGNTDEYPTWAVGHMAAGYLFGKGGVMTAKQFNHTSGWNGNDFKGCEAFTAALFYNARFNNFPDTVLGLANETGDSDSTAAIGGAIAGARYGQLNIAADWRTRIERSAYLHDLASRLWKFSQTVDPKGR